MKEDIFPLLKQTKGVAEINVLGGEQREIRVNIDKDKVPTNQLFTLRNGLKKRRNKFMSANLKSAHFSQT